MRKQLPAAFERLANEEQKFLSGEFLAPRLPYRHVKVRVAGIISQMMIRPPDYSGWGIFKPTDRRHADFVREASMAEREQYLKLFPRVHFLVCGRDERNWFGVQLYPSASISVQGRVPLHLSTDIQVFDTVTARYDGTNFWYDEPYFQRGMEYADFLRQSIQDVLPTPTKTGLLQSELDVYAEMYTKRVAEIEELNKDHNEEKIKAALAHSGAVYLSYRERADGFTVSYRVDGSQYTSTVDKNLRVQSAGICLSGGDTAFDLTSLVEVIREGDQEGAIVITRNPT